MNNHLNKKYAIYSRKSKFTGKGESIENQIEFCRTQLKHEYPNITEDDILVFEDEGFSGGNTNRPNFQKMMKLCEENKICCIICYKLDRISRSTSDFVLLYQHLKDLGVSFLSVKEKFDNSSMGYAMMMIISIFAELERNVTAERIRDNLHELSKTGRWLGGTTPTGYRSVDTFGSLSSTGKVRKAKKLEIIPEEAELVKTLYQKYLELRSITKLETYCLQHHILSKGNKPFNRCTLTIILKNPVYMVADEAAWEYFHLLGSQICFDKSCFNGEHGVIAYNKLNENNKSHHVPNEYREWIIAIGEHRGIISSKDWIEVQKQFAHNQSKSYHRPRSNVALVTGKLFCSCCGSYMRPKLSKRKNRNGEYIYDYLCELKEKSRRQNCDMKRANGNELDRLITEEIHKLTEDKTLFLKTLKRELKSSQVSQSSNSEHLKQLQKSEEEYKAKIEKLLETLTCSTGTLAHDVIVQKINEYSEEVRKLQTKIQEIEQLTQADCSIEEELDKLSAMLCSFSATYDAMPLDTKRSELRKFIHKIVWDGENAHIYFFGAEDEEIDLSGIPESEPLRMGCK